MPFKWTPEAETKLLLAAIKHCDAKPPSEFFESVASIIGPETSSNACAQRFYKMRREADTILGKTSDSSGTNEPATPASTKKKNATPKKTSASSGKKRKNSDADGTGGAGETPPTPSKKAMKTKTKDKGDGSDDELAPETTTKNEPENGVEDEI